METIRVKERTAMTTTKSALRLLVWVPAMTDPASIAGALLITNEPWLSVVMGAIASFVTALLFSAVNVQRL